MEVLNLKLTNFRNFANLAFALGGNLTVILGPNGAGKSNILEALSLLSGLKSARVETDLDLVKFGRREAKIEGEVKSQSPASPAKRGEQSEKKILVINFQVVDPSTGSGQVYVKGAYFIDSIKKRLADFVDYFSVVVFTPLDLELVVGSPSLRRHHLDTLLSSLDRGYWRAINSYSKVVVRRNKVLWRIADGQSKRTELDFWDGRLLEHGKVVSGKRQGFFEFLNFLEGAGPVSRFLPKNLDGFLWRLKQSLLTEEKLKKNRERDIAAGVTLSGPHRDDFRFLYKGRDLEFFGSRGEQRMSVLALKLAELEYFAVKRGSRPVLALDDIFSELDWEHREAVLSVVEKQQTIITAAEATGVPKKIFRKAKVVELR